MIAIMDELGFDKFKVMGHDRGARIGGVEALPRKQRDVPTFPLNIYAIHMHQIVF